MPPVFQGNNIAVKLINTGSSTITSTGAAFTLVWHFESFVTNVDTDATP